MPGASYPALSLSSHDDTSAGYDKPNGTRSFPVAALIASLAKSTADAPSLLEHRSVVLLAHELGHALHELLSKTRYSRFHGQRVGA